MPEAGPAATGPSDANFLAFLNPDLLQVVLSGPRIEHLPPFLRSWPQPQSSRPFRRLNWFSEDSNDRSQFKGLNDYIDTTLARELHIVEASSVTVGPLTTGQRLGQTLRQSLKPKGPGNNDRCCVERIANVLTSLPFIFVGLHARRQLETPEGRAFGFALIATGVAATAYHSASGKLRGALRKLDHWTISATAATMARAVFAAPAPLHHTLGMASVGMAPFQPFTVSAINFGLSEAEFAKEALFSREVPAGGLRGAYLRHVAAGGLGVACYLAEDAAIERGLHFVHPIWHCLACYSVAGAGKLIKHKERRAASAL
eukprot:jgi/Botrbrau1/20111/Bobra.0173s0014.1